MFEPKAIKYAVAASLAAGAFCFAAAAADVGSVPVPATVAEPAPAGPATSAPYTAPRYFNPYTPPQDNPTNPPGTWEVYPSPTNITLFDVCFVNRNEGWAVGCSGHNGVILRYLNGNWEVFFEDRGINFWEIDMVTSTDGWIIATDTRTPEKDEFWRWNGEKWQTYQRLEDCGLLFCIDVVDANYGWAGGGEGFYFFNGNNWLKYEGSTHWVSGIQIKSRGVGRAVAGSFIYRLNGDKWFNEARILGTVLREIYMLPNSTGWACGRTYGVPSEQYGLLLRYDVTWQLHRIIEESYWIRDMDFSGNNYGWCVGYRERPFPHGPFLAFFNGEEWTVVKGPGENGLIGVGVVDENTAWAVGLYGTILKYKPNGHPVVIPTSLGTIKSLFK